MQHVIEPYTCPCGAVNDRASGVNGPQPEAGSISICARCAGISIFSSATEQRPITPEELEEARKSPDWKIVTNAVAAINAYNHKKRLRLN